MQSDDQKPAESELFIKTSAQEISEKFTEEEIRKQIQEFGQFLSEREKIRVLYLDDEQMELDNFQGLYRRDFKVFVTSSYKEAQEIVAKENLHVILTDQRMDQMTGVEFLKSIIDKYPDPVRILVTGYADINAVIEAINEGQIFKYISKPYRKEEMYHTIQSAAEVFFLRREREELLQKLTRTTNQLEFMLRQKLID
jgi:DNA-binding NtrC family response regulator